MSKMSADELDEKPLDPEVEKVRRKMVRLLAVSIGIMIVGVMAVLAAVVYRVTQGGEDAPEREVAGQAFPTAADAPLAARAELPDDFTVAEVALDGSRILFFGEDDDGIRRAFVFDIAEARIVAEVEIGAAP